MRLWQYIKKKTADFGGFKSKQDAGIRVSSRLESVTKVVRVGFVKILNTFGASSVVKSSGRVSFSPFSWNKNKAVAPVVSGNGSGSADKPGGVPAGQLTQLSFSLLSEDGASTVTQYPINGREDWDNVNNTSGKANSTYADIEASSGGLLFRTAHYGGLDFVFPDFVGKDEFDITRAELHFYGILTGVTASNALMSFGFSRDGSEGDRVIMGLVNQDSDFSGTPLVFDILDLTLGGTRPNGITTWDQLDTVRAQVEFFGTAFSGADGFIDAVHLVVEGNLVDIIP